ncbi:two-component regulator propeller domain-containing protein [Paraprevotella xylaniphila]|uniref:two-component regulator propeller domain-containing protein n=1 Tax=Paraprevotella xylaniphila TaxID=454155 RepID=UPI003FD7EC8D
MRNVFFLLLSLLASTHTHAGLKGKLPLGWMDRYSFMTIGIEQGLSHNFVEDMKKDSRGFLWVATNGGGLCRYDSYQFICLDQETARYSLKSNFIKAICEDPFKRLWISGEEGLECVDINTLRPSEVACDIPRWDMLRQLEYYDLHCDEYGNIWLIGKHGVHRLEFDAEGRIIRIWDAFDFQAQEHSTAFHEGKDAFWIGISNRIYIARKDGSPHPVPLSGATLPLNTHIQVLYERGDELWIGTTNGLFRYNTVHKNLCSYHPTKDIHSLTQDFITDITESNDHRILVSTLKGFNIYREQTDDFERVYSENLTGSSQNVPFCDFINCLLADHQVLWVGTEANGLIKLTPKRLMAKNFMQANHAEKKQTPHAVNAIYEDPEGYLYIGTIEGGLSRLNPHRDETSHYTTQDGLPHNAVSCLTGNKNTIWAGTWGGGICQIDRPRSGHPTIRHLTFDGYPDATCGYVCAVHYDHVSGKLWIITSYDIYTYDLSNQKLERPFEGKKLGGMQNGNAGSCIDNDQNLWLGLTSGLCRINLNRTNSGKYAYQLWPFLPDRPHSKAKTRTTFVATASSNRLLVGTNGNGFYIVTRKDDNHYAFKQYSTRDGLANNNVRGIVEDEHGRIWISTLHGLSCFFPRRKRFQNYTRQDGLANDQFYWNAAYKGHDGTLYFGSMTGLSAILPDSIQALSPKSIPVAFTRFRTLKGEIPLGDGTVDLHERDKFVSIEFAALDFNATPQAAYAYRLKGINDRWTVVTASNRNLSYANLPAGHYTLEVRYAPDGTNFENAGKAEMDIRIYPYFYKTAWFRILVCTSFILMIYLLYKWRVRSLKRQKDELHCKVTERTREIEVQKHLLAQRSDALEQQNKMLNRQKAEILYKSRRIQELTAEKLAFFTNITHEFRTPLTLIIGPVRHLLETNTDIETNKQLQIVDRNSHYLLSLVNQLLDFRKVESGNMKITLHEGYLLPLFQNLKLLFSAYAAEKGLRIQYYFHLPECTVSFDEDALHKILFNLVSNAIKFTPKGGCIKLFTKTLTSTSGSLLFVSVCDTGPGVAEKDKEMIFQRFHQSDKRPCTSINGQSGTGIGLYLCRQLVQLQGGKIWVVNNRTAGCSFRFLLPLHLIEASPSTRVQISLPKSPETHKKMMETEKSSINLLIVEDNKDMREYLHTILSPYYHCLEASQGKEALDILHTQHVDFILSDLMMPIMDGMELSRHVKSDFSISHIPFLILTAKTSETAHIQSFEFGVDAYLTKPFDEHLLLTRIENLLRNRKRLQEKFAYHMISEELHIKAGTQDQAFMDKLLDLLKKNYSNAEYGVDEFSVDMGISRSLLYKKTQELTGTAIGELLRNYRLNIAKEILISKTGHTLNISEIAYQVGFNDPKYFTRCFTKHFNVPPSKFTGK